METVNEIVNQNETLLFFCFTFSCALPQGTEQLTDGKESSPLVDAKL